MYSMYIYVFFFCYLMNYFLFIDMLYILKNETVYLVLSRKTILSQHTQLELKKARDYCFFFFVFICFFKFFSIKISLEFS